jgi:hypothetical protein
MLNIISDKGIANHNYYEKLGMVVHTCNLNIQEAKAGEF